MTAIQRLGKADRILLLTLLLAFFFCLHGIHWGRVEPWNPDQLAYVRVFYPGEMPFNPKNFLRPPFHTYSNYIFSHIPVYILGISLGWPSRTLLEVNLLTSRLLTALLFLGSVGLVFVVSRRAFGNTAGRCVALIFGTSAGFVAFSHFLTTDMPVTFWMLLSLLFAHNILLNTRMRDYVLAGLFAGIATATKYNGLVMGAALLAAHLVSQDPFSWRQALLDKRIYIGFLMILLGFFIGNPYALLDYNTFISDFMFNNLTAPIYSGTATGTSYLTFFLRAIEVIGFPGFVLCLTSLIFAVPYLIQTPGFGIHKKTALVVLAVLLPYYALFGSFARLPARFVAPILPFWLILSGPLWVQSARFRWLALGRILVPLLTTLVLVYNVVCSSLVGRRFAEDPRMGAQEWVDSNIPEGSTIESSPYTPRWALVTDQRLVEVRSPFVSGKNKLFRDLRSENRWVADRLNRETEDEEWYSKEGLLGRSPDYVAIDSLYYDRFTDPDYVEGEYYPSIRAFFQGLLDERFGYTIIYDHETKAVPAWIYPREIDFLHNRIVILKRDLPAHGLPPGPSKGLSLKAGVGISGEIE